MFIYDLANWPEFEFDEAALASQLAAVRYQQGLLLGRMQGLGFGLQEEAYLRTLTEDVVKSGEIEGEILDRDQVRSSIASRLGIDIGGLKKADREVEGFCQMMVDATQNFEVKLTKKRLCGWHRLLFPFGKSGGLKIKTGDYRDDARGPMQVVSGWMGKERVHFRAPEAERLSKEMSVFLSWFNGEPSIDPVIKSGIAHLWFLTLHPFEDGNGRIARAIADMALSLAERSKRRFYSMSNQIREERKSYYQLLEDTQKGLMDITAWLTWYLGCLERSIQAAETSLDFVVRKSNFWTVHATTSLNERQRKVLQKLLEGFQGKLTSSKWASLAGCSQDTAIRDINDLIDKQIIEKAEAGGRSTSYQLIRI